SWLVLSVSTSVYERVAGTNFHVPVELGFAICTYHCAMYAASSEETVPFPLTSAASCWVPFIVIMCTTCCAILAESRADMPLTFPVFEGVLVYVSRPHHIKC